VYVIQSFQVKFVLRKCMIELSSMGQGSDDLKIKLGKIYTELFLKTTASGQVVLDLSPISVDT